MNLAPLGVKMDRSDLFEELAGAFPRLADQVGAVETLEQFKNRLLRWMNSQDNSTPVNGCQKKGDFLDSRAGVIANREAGHPCCSDSHSTFQKTFLKMIFIRNPILYICSFVESQFL